MVDRISWYCSGVMRLGRGSPRCLCLLSVNPIILYPCRTCPCWGDSVVPDIGCASPCAIYCGAGIIN